MPKLPVNRLVIVEDNLALSDTLSEFVRLEPRLSLVEVFSSVTDTLAWLREMSAKVTIDLLLLDLHLPDQDGWSILDEWILRGRTPRTLIYSGKIDSYSLWRARRAPVQGIIAKPEEGFDAVCRALLHLTTGGRYFSPSIEAAIANRVRDTSSWWHKLTPRETQLMPYFGRGESDLQIAARINISDTTVRSHRHNVLAKLDLPSSAALVAWAHEQGFVRDTAMGRALEIV